MHRWQTHFYGNESVTGASSMKRSKFEKNSIHECVKGASREHQETSRKGIRGESFESIKGESREHQRSIGRSSKGHRESIKEASREHQGESRENRRGIIRVSRSIKGQGRIQEMGMVVNRGGGGI